MKKIYSYLPLLMLFFFQTNYAQISFTNQNDNLLTNTDFHSGVAIGVTDMNNDGLDDIIRMDQGYQAYIEYQVPGGMFTTQFVGAIGNESHWSMCVADVDNNGFNEIFAGGSYNGIKVAMASEDGSEYVIEDLEDLNGIFVQGSNFADINNDGFIDLFACHDDAESFIWGNDGTGQLEIHNEWIDMASDPVSDNSGNYGSIWTDFDNDGDIDLYIAKCRQSVSDPTDPRRINTLFVNDGNGNYTEMAGEYGLKVDYQSWTADFQDVNNDGWLDCLITNHDHEAQLLINDGTGHYTEAMNTGIDIANFPIQGVMRDFDNDGWVDVIVAGGSQHIFRNNGDLTFTEIQGVFDSNTMESFALGDLNGDGFIDVYGGYANIYTNPSSIDDVVWINDANNGNNFLSVKLQGTISNKNAIGSRIEIYGDWGIQIREVRSGESYGIMNSMIQYFGLGQASEIDSVVVRWTSGIVQTETNVDINSNILLLEGGCITAAPTLDVDGATTFCTGETITLTAPSGYSSYEWSTGETLESITVGSQGSFGVTVTDSLGCFGFSSSVTTIVDPELSPEIIANGPLVFCEGEAVELEEIGAPTATSYTWSNGLLGPGATITESGEYYIIAEGLCASYNSNSIIVMVEDAPNAPAAVGDTVAVSEVAEVSATGTNLVWYEEAIGGTPIGFGANFTTPAILEADTFYVADQNITDGIEENVGMEGHVGSNYSGNQNSNNDIIFDAFSPFTLDSVKVYTDVAGVRKMLLQDQNENVLAEAEIDVPEGESVVFVGMEIPEGEGLILTTDFLTNQMNLGIGGPRLRRSNNDVNYPYVIQDIVSINQSNFGMNWYYYFFDWQITTPDFVCEGERSAVPVLLDTDVATIDFGKTNDVKVYPNPTDGQIALEIKFDISEKVNLRIFDLTGKQVFENQIQNPISEYNLQDLAKGVYTIQITHGADIYNGKIVIQ